MKCCNLDFLIIVCIRNVTLSNLKLSENAKIVIVQAIKKMIITYKVFFLVLCVESSLQKKHSFLNELYLSSLHISKMK